MEAREMDLNSLFEQIRELLDVKLGKLETDIKSNIGELKSQLNELASRHSETSERLTAVEGTAKSCDTAKIDQGRRLGQLENDLTTLRVTLQTEAQVKERLGQNTGNWIRWLPSVIFGILGAVGIIVALVK